MQFFTTSRFAVLLLVAALTVTISGCGSRGTFGPKACSQPERIDVPSKAVIAIYYDSEGQPVGTYGIGEDMTGTFRNHMCETPDPSDADCPTGYCMKNIGGTNYCLKGQC
jgi:hypothetical protein